MNWKRLVLASALGSAAAMWGAAAQAQRAHVGVRVDAPAAGHEIPEGEERYETSYPERPIVMAPMVLSPITGLTLARFGGDLGGDTTGVGMPIGAKFGVIRNLEARAFVVPLVFAPSALAGYGGLEAEHLEGPSFGATYRFLRGGIEIGGAFDLTIVTGKGATGVIAQPSIPARIHLGRTAALDTGIYLPIRSVSLRGASETSVALKVPVALSVDVVAPSVHVGANTGFEIDDFNDAGHNVAIPLGVFGGYAVRGHHGPILDIDPFFRWPELLRPGAEKVGINGGDKFDAGHFETGVELAFYLYL